MSDVSLEVFLPRSDDPTQTDLNAQLGFNKKVELNLQCFYAECEFNPYGFTTQATSNGDGAMINQQLGYNYDWFNGTPFLKPGYREYDNPLWYSFDMKISNAISP
jgi:hypothetical protein